MRTAFPLAWLKPGLLTLAGLFLLTAPAFAAEPSAKQFLASIYKAYSGDNANGLDWRSPKASRYFDQSLAQLILKDIRESDGEVGRIDFDPFVGGQDFEISKLDIAVTENGLERAEVIAAFNNFGAPMKITYQLAKTAKGWRISDIAWKADKAEDVSAESFRSLLTKPLP
ncbi:DUF3828 domain-containing protein [Microvirga flavescens]|uniref:DUF3828 domain-containing protein n=1 Tax=Microvirga flavescens TaxID=2249811 RepID=UPI000DDB9FE1|nr:DUF3828 domain-containing protein [Microvirga flavescens]